jgi:hypothetical protein
VGPSDVGWYQHHKHDVRVFVADICDPCVNGAR